MDRHRVGKTLGRVNCDIFTVRFTNKDVMKNLDGVLMHLHEVLVALNHPLTPSSSKEGE